MLRDHLPPGRLVDAGAILDRFLAWVAEQGIVAYPAQEQALLELLAGRHVVLSTPTGSGKSLVALGLHFQALCQGERSFYTAPVKALASEKFFALCREVGAEQVGLLTGDASVNPGAPVVCCTAEVLAQMALREGASLDAPHVVMDEFHFYADRDRGAAWQIPLLELPRTRFLLMSATLGNTAAIESALERRSGRPVAHVHGTERPVPLDFDYREASLHETVEALLEEGRAPIYIVHFTHREAAESAQGLTSARVATREQRKRISEALAGERFDTPYGKDVRRFLRHGIGLHHAGLLPRYRLLVERLAQQGLLRVICGTDTLGVGVNVPIRTVLFSKLCKYDGERVRILSVRDFRQIAGRAGRRGFDDQGSVVALAPPHVVEARRARERAAARGRARPKGTRRPPRGLVPWGRETFERLVERPPEPLESQLRLGHGTLVALLRREGSGDGPAACGYRAAIELVGRSHEGTARKRALRREAAEMFRALRRAGVIELAPDPARRGRVARVRDDLQHDFSLHHALSLYLVDAVSRLDPDAPDYALDVLTLTEAILENPRPVLEAQRRKAREAQLVELKAEGVPFEERIARLDEVSYPRPRAELVEETFARFEEEHPWVGAEHLRPKSIAREMVEREEPFADYVRRYGLQRSEGVLLRHLAQVYGTLARTVPAAARTDALEEAMAFLRAVCTRADASIAEAWERARGDVQTEAVLDAEVPAPPPVDLARDERALRARVRTEMRQLVRALARGDAEEAARWMRPHRDEVWDAARIGEALAAIEAEDGPIAWTPAARAAHQTLLKPTEPRRWDVYQTLVDASGHSVGCVEGEIDLSDGGDPDGPLVGVRRIGP